VQFSPSPPADLVGENAPVSTVPAVVLTVLAGPCIANEPPSEHTDSVRTVGK